MNYALETFKIIFYLALVLGIIYLTAMLFRKRLTGQGESRYINVLERSFPAAKTTLTLVEVKGRVYLLGIGEQGVNVLDKWEQEEFGELPVQASTSLDFKNHLQTFVQKIRNDENE